MTIILLTITLLLIINTVLYCIYKRKCSWRIVYVDKNSRGVNSDTWYWEVPSHDGKKVWLTDEQLLTGKVRADGLETHPHIKVNTD